MTTYICKCGQRVQKSSNADNTGNRLEGYGPDHECYGCPYAMPWGGNEWDKAAKRFVQDIKGYECRTSRTLSYDSHFIGSTEDKCTCSVVSLDFDFLEQISAWVKDTFPLGELTGGFSRDEIRPTDYSHNGRYCCTFVCASNKKGIAAKAALFARFFDPDGSRKDMTPQQEMEKILADIRKCTQEPPAAEDVAVAALPPAEAAEPFGNIPAAPTFDFSALGDLSQQAADADQQFDLHYGAAQDEYLISCIYLARIHALTAKAGRYGGGTWTKWYESKGLSEGSARTMVKNGDAFNSATVAELKQLPELTRKDLNLIARSGCAGQLVEAAGDSQRVRELLARLKAEKERANAAEAREEEARKAAHEYHEKYEEAAAMRATLLDQQGVYIADIDGLKKQNAKLQQSYHDAYESRIAANLQCQKAEAERDRAEARAKDAENQLSGSRQVAEAAKLRADKLQAENAALKKQPITAVIDEEEIDRRAAEKAWGLADARNAELAKDNANLKKQVAALRSRINDDAQADFEQANYCASLMRAAWDNSKASYSRLVGEDLESTFQTICGTLNSIMEEASLLCRQPPDYDGGDRDE